MGIPSSGDSEQWGFRPVGIPSSGDSVQWVFRPVGIPGGSCLEVFFVLVFILSWSRSKILKLDEFMPMYGHIVFGSQLSHFLFNLDEILYTSSVDH